MLAACETGCSLLDPQLESIAKVRGFGQEFSPQPVDAIASRYAAYAVLSALTYQPHVCGDDRALDQPYAESRPREDVVDALTRTFGPTIPLGTLASFATHWSSACAAGVLPGHSGDRGAMDDGLRVDVWQRTDESMACTEAVIAIRGSYSTLDWVSDFRWVRTVFPFLSHLIPKDRYALLDKKISGLLTRVKDLHCAEITVTGHSLGGGLAQLAARLGRGQIKRVYVFNSSDVIGDEIAPARATDDFVVERVYERGEALTYVRRDLEKLNPRVGGLSCHPLIVDIRFSFDESLLASRRHSMDALARGLLLAAGRFDAGADRRNVLQVLDMPMPNCDSSL